jgi:beta-lactamase class A
MRAGVWLRLVIVVILVAVAITPAAASVRADTQGAAFSVVAADSAIASVVAKAAAPASAVSGTGTGLARNTTGLTAAVQELVAQSGASAGVTLIELGGPQPITWAINGTTVFAAASTYKLAALMMEAENVAAGKTDPNGAVCFEASDYEAGWFDDYMAGACYTRSELAWRAGSKSDNTAGHMLVRDLGGADALNAWAASAGATARSSLPTTPRPRMTWPPSGGPKPAEASAARRPRHGFTPC